MTISVRFHAQSLWPWKYDAERRYGRDSKTIRVSTSENRTMATQGTVRRITACGLTTRRLSPKVLMCQLFAICEWYNSSPSLASFVAYIYCFQFCINEKLGLDFKLSPCYECCVLSSGPFPGVWNSDAGEWPRRKHTIRTSEVIISIISRVNTM